MLHICNKIALSGFFLSFQTFFLRSEQSVIPLKSLPENIYDTEDNQVWLRRLDLNQQQNIQHQRNIPVKVWQQIDTEDEAPREYRSAGLSNELSKSAGKLMICYYAYICY